MTCVSEIYSQKINDQKVRHRFQISLLILAKFKQIN